MSLPLFPVCLDHTCCGRTQNCSSWARTFPMGFSYSITSVLSSGALNSLMFDRAADRAAVGPARYLRMVFPVHAASAAVRGLPSDHLPPGLRLKVHVRPSGVCDQSSAQSPSILIPGPY